MEMRAEVSSQRGLFRLVYRCRIGMARRDLGVSWLRNNKESVKCCCEMNGRLNLNARIIEKKKLLIYDSTRKFMHNLFIVIYIYS